METEKIINVQSEVTKQKSFSKTMGEWSREAHEEGKVFNHSAARRDFEDGVLKSSWRDYSKDAKEVGRATVRDKKTNKPTGVMVDYRFPDGSMASIELTNEEIELLSPTKKK